ncbi:ATP-binding protein [Clostridium aminobutyricum]|uniref:Circadian input-output histidine kinase CikA n=1 Tax=Clostridium aminobutyricum TaxID=33953 RepID=A0A939IIH7_CLOAM|nr:ATP-binding protein [Clostridium aminobutyricum]MBN7773081.1 response regulator [Clostridium aminobutyricum]
MLNKLNYLLVSMITMLVMLIACLASYAYQNNNLLEFEKMGSSLLTFNNIYDQTFGQLTNDAVACITTDDPTLKYSFTEDANNFISCNLSNINYIRFSDNRELTGFEMLTNSTTNPSFSTSDFSFDQKEQKYYLSYLEAYNNLIHLTISAVNEGDSTKLQGARFLELYSSKEALSSNYTEHFLNRIEEKKLKVTAYCKILAILAGLLTVTLICCTLRAASLYFKSNKRNLYFNQLYSKAIENADVGLAIVDRHYKYEYMNAMYKRIFNIQVSNPLGFTSFSVLPDEIATSLPAHSLSENRKNIILTYTLNGEVKYINYSCFAIFDEKGEPKFVTLVQDCTESKKKDNEMMKQLKDIEYYANAKSSFIANVSHEIKTPLNVIIGMVHILKNTDLTEKQSDILSKINISSELLLNIINDVLDISKIQKSSFVLYPTDFNLLNMLQESEEIFTPIISSKNLKFEKNYDFNKDLCLNIDRTRLAQVLLNLVNNACKFTSSGHIKLSVGRLSEHGNLVLMKFSVEDTGLGINEDDLSKVFQEFEQLENHLTKQHQGTGLGLAICKHVINAMGGDIWVESVKGQGSCFNFTIWAHKSDAATCEDLNAAATSVPLLNGAGKKILVVEDTELNYEVTENLLSESQIICDHACDGQQAIDMCIALPPDYYSVILMDIHMPNIDGYTAAEILKTEIGVTSPILALTATNIDSDTKKEHENIMDGFISKPFRYHDLYRALLPYFGDINDIKWKPIPPMKSQIIPAISYVTADDETFEFSIARAAQNLGCSEKQYEKHLLKFKKSFENVDRDIQELILDNNFTEARRIAHSVKGLAGTLGLVPLYKVAAELEATIMDHPDRVSILLPTFTDHLKGICRATNIH